MISIEEIKNFFRGYIALNEPLNKHTSFRIGGPADYYFEPDDKEDTVLIVGFLLRQDIPFVTIGKGTNLLVSDEGYRGAVVNLEKSLKSMYAEGNRIYAEAGVSLNRFVDFCIQRELQGVEMLAGIPGTIGGAVIMNAGAYGGEISNYFVNTEIVRSKTIVVLKKEEIGFTYRRSAFRKDDVVLSASFELPKGNREELMKKRNDLVLQRNRKHPVDYPNCGSVFKNPDSSPTARLVEMAGLKGRQIGDAQIAEKHGNFIINLGDAAAEDVLALMNLIRKTIYEKFGITLEPEVKMIGFPNRSLKDFAL